LKKDISQRIAYYVRKVAERAAHHPAKKLPVAYKYRSESLMTYKKRMHELIAEGGYQR
jgi:hypothetical protein